MKINYFNDSIPLRPTYIPPESDHHTESNNEPLISTVSQNCGRGRGYLVNRLKQIQGFARILPAESVLPREIKINFVDDRPIRSTYIPPEPDQNDESIYENGIHSGINFEKLNEVDVKVSGKDVPAIFESFETCDKIPNNIMKNIKKCKFIKPTPIQKYSIPIILSGKDLMATAQTGSGKTVIK